MMEALDKSGTISEQLKSILERLNKLDIIENSVKSIETNLANLKARTAKLEQKLEQNSSNGCEGHKEPERIMQL